MKIYFRRGNSVLCQKFGDAHVVAVFRALEIVFYQNERLLRHATNTVEPAIGTTLFNRRDLDLSLAEAGQTPARLAKKQLRFHQRQSSPAPVQLGARGHFSPLPEAILGSEGSAVSIFLWQVCDEGPDI